jgi:alkanesulfonate monooxygenase SsuD/methylene tetrahydromethanopterin reductase-like flavin-dependent oxidoreductase (luciferase family)
MVGGGGEKRTLKSVARYADACNIFGDAETIRHKMKVLDEHCAAAGRNPRDITRTALKTLAIGRDAGAAAKKAEPLHARFGKRFNVIGLAGGREEVRAQVRELREAGLDGLIVNLPDAYDLDTVALAGDALSGF